jgi:hypothetical protein
MDKAFATRASRTGRRTTRAAANLLVSSEILGSCLWEHSQG